MWKNSNKNRNLLISLKVAFNGIKLSFLSERNIRIQTIAFIIVVIAGLFFQISKIEWIAVLLTSGIILSIEILNSAIEQILDFSHPHHHKKIGMIKDVSAGAVLIISSFALLVGLIIFVPYLIDFIDLYFD
ncbi:diacylglycerol kinase family protein [Marinilabiliaceae bacterium JC017]|nr:diacylglycerol kinase family protein [Marinilabiliaceae bacterium JC017]